LRLSKAVIIAIYGKSCVGKSTTANALGQLYRIEVRKCGELVKSRAIQLGIDPEQLSHDDHKAIDEETQRLATAGRSVIVEGVFLDRVLSAGTPNLISVELTCSEDERSRRFAQKYAHAKLDLKQRDVVDCKTAAGLYSSPEAKMQPNVTIDTTSLSPSGVVGALVRWLETKPGN
jgi:cytidylate kinase